MYAYYNNNINDFTILSLSLYSNNSIPLAVVEVLRIRQVKHLNAISNSSLKSSFLLKRERIIFNLTLDKTSRRFESLI